MLSAQRLGFATRISVGAQQSMRIVTTAPITTLTDKLTAATSIVLTILPVSHSRKSVMTPSTTISTD